MRHRKSGRQLNRNSSHRQAMLRNLASSLLRHETIKTTLPKAKELCRIVESLITLAKNDYIAHKGNYEVKKKEYEAKHGEYKVAKEKYKIKVEELVTESEEYKSKQEEAKNFLGFEKYLNNFKKLLKTDLNKRLKEKHSQLDEFDKYNTTKKIKESAIKPVAKHLAKYRQALNYLRDNEIVTKLFNDLGPGFAERPGGYTRILKYGFRAGDNAPMVYIQLVEPDHITK